MLNTPPVLESPPPRAPRRRFSGVPKLLVRSVLLSLPFVLFLLFFEIRFSHLNPSHFSAKKHLLERQASAIEILVTGLSHAFVGIDPTLLGRPAFNLAGNSQSLFYDVALIRKYRPSLPRLKLVIMPISFMSLETELDQGAERWRCYYYRYFFSLPHRDWRMAWSARNYSAWFLCGSEIRRTDVLFGTCPDARQQYDIWGGWTNRAYGDSLSLEPNLPYLRRTGSADAKRHVLGMRRENLEVNVARLADLIQELRGSGVEIVFVTLPVSHFYSDHIQSEAYARMQAAMTALQQKYNVAYFNYLYDQRFADSDYQDADHLNSRGASKFTSILRGDVAHFTTGHLPALSGGVPNSPVPF